MVIIFFLPSSFLRELGRGYYGTVYLAEELSGRLVAVKSNASKTSATATSSESPARRPDFSSECAILKTLGRHVNLVKLVGHSEAKDLLAFEYCQHGSIADYVNKNR